ncbi:MAG: DUF4293 domain-containing protein [Bacteroidota bacterium]|nr:DUF4293 domain-containing protein [Bacteroidota bacterium]MDX5430289.1 DUF4293 domain-containing protein [Bacteroidota bacterium]MDX5469050.1 DUF4293 domain-containing protein [Bacteroidota bacterium]
MIQRKQSIYLALIVLFAIGFLAGNPTMYSISGIDQWTKGGTGILEVSILKIDGMVGEESAFATWNSYLIYAISCIGLLALLATFQFKNRKMQLLLCGFNYLAMAIAAVLCYLYIQEGKSWVTEVESSGIHYLFLSGALLPVWNFLAMKGIMQDEKLIRSMDRLR